MNGKWGLVRSYYPNVLAPAVYDEIKWLSKNCILVKKGEYYGILDTLGVEKIKPDTYYETRPRTPFGSEEILTGLSSSKQNILVDENGKVIARNFNEIRHKRGNLMIIQVHSEDSIQRKLFFTEKDNKSLYKQGLLKTDGNWLIRPVERHLYFANDHCIAATEHLYSSSILALLDLNGKPLMKEGNLTYMYDRSISDSLRKIKQFAVQNEGTVWFIDSMGTIVAKQPRNLSEANVVMDPATKKYGCKQNGTWIIPPRYAFIGVSLHYVVASDNPTKTDIYDKRGELVASKDSITLYSSKMMRGKTEDKELMFGRRGDSTFLLNEKFIPISIPFDQAMPVIYSKKETTLFSFIKNNQIGVMNQAGKIIIEPIPYHNELFEKDNFIWVKSEHSTFNLYDLNGNLILTNISTVRASSINPENCYVMKNGQETVYSRSASKVIIPGGTYSSFREIPELGVVVADNKNEQFILGKNFQPLSKTSYTSIYMDRNILVLTAKNGKKQVLDTSNSKFSEEYDQIYSGIQFNPTGLNTKIVVRTARKYGLIDAGGKVIARCEWDTLLFSVKKVVLKSGQKFYLTDTNFVLDKNTYADSISQYFWGEGMFYKTKDAWRPLDYSYAEAKFDQILQYAYNQVVSVKKNGKYGVYSLTQGKWVVRPVFESSVTCANQYNNPLQVFFTQKEGKKHLIDTHKHRMIEPGYDFIDPLFLMVDEPNSNCKNYLVNTGGKKTAAIVANSKTMVPSGGTFGLINTKGKLLHPLNGNQAIPLIDQNYAYVDYDDYEPANVLGFLWNSGGTTEEYISYMPDSVDQEVFDERGNSYTVRLAPPPSSYSKKITGGKFGIVGPNGNEILPVIYDKIVFMYNDERNYSDRERHYRKNYSEFVYDSPNGKLLLYPVFLKKDKQWGAADLNGSIVIPVTYDSIVDVTSNTRKLIQVWKNGNFGYFDLFGTTVLPIEYSGEQYYETSHYLLDKFAIFQKGGLVTNYSLFRERQEDIFTPEGNVSEIKRKITDTITLQQFTRGKLGIYDPLNFTWFLIPEYDDIRFKQVLGELSGDRKVERVSLRERVTRIPTFSFYKYYSDIFFEIKKAGKWGIYSFDRGLLIEPQYEDIESMAPVIGPKTEQIYRSEEYEKVKEIAPAGGFKFKQDGKWGILSKDGNILLNAEYDSITFTEARLYKAIKGDDAQFFTEQGVPK